MAKTRSGVRSIPGKSKGTKKASSRRGAKSDLTVSLPQFISEGSDLEFRQFVADLFAAVAGMYSLRRALASSVGLSAAAYSVILGTWHLQRKGPVGITAIARQLHVAAAHVTAEVGDLVELGLLIKKPHPRDTRAVLIEITDDGKALLARLTPLLRKINDRLFSGNKPSDIEILSRFVQHLADESAHSIRLAQAYAAESAPKKLQKRRLANDL
jgi:MarR family transcriptional regulator, organic hydroperoxide resistance regulator